MLYRELPRFLDWKLSARRFFFLVLSLAEGIGRGCNAFLLIMIESWLGREKPHASLPLSPFPRGPFGNPPPLLYRFDWTFPQPFSGGFLSLPASSSVASLFPPSGAAPSSEVVSRGKTFPPCWFFIFPLLNLLPQWSLPGRGIP